MCLSGHTTHWQLHTSTAKAANDCVTCHNTPASSSSGVNSGLGRSTQFFPGEFNVAATTLSARIPWIKETPSLGSSAGMESIERNPWRPVILLLDRGAPQHKICWHTEDPCWLCSLLSRGISGQWKLIPADSNIILRLPRLDTWMDWIGYFWLASNFLSLNESKTELIVFGSNKHCVHNFEAEFLTPHSTTCVRKLGFWFDITF